jgi:16S rRNA (adenine1518-N6/adenine1519-N6)-dimethyltransferase
MFQREVAERICARPGEDAYGRLGVLAGWRTDARIAFNVSRQAFVPPPNVTSAVVLLRPRAIAPEPSVRHLEEITRAAFGQRRKMLRQSLKSTGVDVEALLAAGGLKGDERAEIVPVETFLEMAKALPRLRDRAK